MVKVVVASSEVGEVDKCLTQITSTT